MVSIGQREAGLGSLQGRIQLSRASCSTFAVVIFASLSRGKGSIVESSSKRRWQAEGVVHRFESLQLSIERIDRGNL